MNGAVRFFNPREGGKRGRDVITRKPRGALFLGVSEKREISDNAPPLGFVSKETSLSPKLVKVRLFVVSNVNS